MKRFPFGFEVACGHADRQCRTTEDWPELKITKAVWEEAMRMYPPAFLNGRQAVSDCELGGFTIPQGAQVMLSVVGIHNDPRIWPAPERFDPTRFLDAATKPPRGAYFPFGLGTRTCIAQSMATMESLFILARLYQRFRLSFVPGTTVTPKVRMSIQFEQGPMMKVSRRSPTATSTDGLLAGEMAPQRTVTRKNSGQP